LKIRNTITVGFENLGMRILICPTDFFGENLESFSNYQISKFSN
jgi:hypothetical protein